MRYKLYLDESGTPGIPVVGSFPYFILSGIIIKVNQSERLKIEADKIKFKYWSESPAGTHRGLVFHSREIGRRENDFSLLKDPVIEQKFHKDLFNFLHGSGVKCIIVAVDKEKAAKQGWDVKDIYQKGTDEIIRMFIEFLSKKGSGEVIIESAGTQKDIIFYKNYIHYLANGMVSIGLTQKDMKKTLTSISFVSKNNFDIETQIADLLAYPAGYKCLVDNRKKEIIPNSYEEKMCAIMNNKLINIGNRKSFINLPVI